MVRRLGRIDADINIDLNAPPVDKVDDGGYGSQVGVSGDDLLERGALLLHGCQLSAVWGLWERWVRHRYRRSERKLEWSLLGANGTQLTTGKGLLATRVHMERTIDWEVDIII